MREFSDAARRASLTVGFVPTMGALHDGHLALVTEAKRRCDVVVVSIFVNPMQFDRSSDFDAYPRPIEHDVSLCAAAGVDAVYAPTAATMYPAGFDTVVEVGEVSLPLEGAGRPGHFRGVTTVVTKLFAAVRPDVAVFGQKDFQQLAIIRRMNTDLDLGIDIVGLPTVREPDGLAMSSRNSRLSSEQRAVAACISQGLFAAAAAAASGVRGAQQLIDVAQAPVSAEPSARTEYLQLVDPHTLQPVHTLVDESLLVTAVWFGDVRLIDNVLLGNRA
jgi:pantoate--beta-alanine ligase